MTETKRQYVYSVKKSNRNEEKRRGLLSKNIRGIRFDYDGNAVRKTYEIDPTPKRNKSPKQNPKQNNYTNHLVVLGASLVLLLCVLLPMVSISGVDKITNNKIAELNSKISAQQVENKNNMKIYDNKVSLNNIIQKGAGMGFVQADKVEKLTPTEFISH
ncbi:MAG: hypothetical protein IJS60_09865 [Abditibacteriota bacterium]|nr:hypothetical protein [Abditibacteriota bacterium]